MGNVNMEARQIHYRGGEKPMSVEEAIKEAGSGYVLPIASAETLGGIKVGDNLTINSETGALSGPAAYTLPTASAGTLGGVKVGDGLAINAETGVLSATGGISVHTVEYTGTGTASKSVQFASKPSYILGIFNTEHAVYIMGFSPDQLGTIVSWEYPSVGMGHINLAYNSETNTLTWTGSDEGQALNTNGSSYKLLYI